MKPLELLKIVISISLPILLGTPLLFMSGESLQAFVHEFNFPTYAPPKWVFPLVWAYMYAGMGVSMWLVWDSPRTKKRNIALKVYMAQLVLNVAFNILFFYKNNLGIAFLILVVAWFTVIVMLNLFYKQKPLAAYLNLPYFIWRTYTLFLAYSSWQINS